MLDFLNTKLTTSGGVNTQYNKNLGTNGIILSESQGLLMEIGLLTRDRRLFDGSYNFLKNNMQLDNGLFSWKYNLKTKEKTNVNATIDDLRIYRNLVFANIVWGGYEKQIKSLEKGFMKLKKKGYLIDFYDGYNNSTEVSLHYFDSISVKILGDRYSMFNSLLVKHSDLISQGRSTNNFPIYSERYNISHNSFEHKNNHMTLNSLLILYNRKLYGEDISKDYQFMKTIFNKNNGIFSSINENGQFNGSIESSAVYGVLRLIAKAENDYEFIRKIDSQIS